MAKENDNNVEKKVKTNKKEINKKEIDKKVTIKKTNAKTVEEKPKNKKTPSKKSEISTVKKEVKNIKTLDTRLKPIVDAENIQNKVYDSKTVKTKKTLKETNSLNFFKTDKSKIGIIEVIFSSIVICIIGILIGFLLSNKENKISDNKPVNTDSLIEFIETYEYILNNYYGDTEITKDTLLESALQGMLGSLNDPNSVYMDEDASENFNITLEGSYEGIGVEIINDSSTGLGNVTILSVFGDSPAAKAGLKPGDIILKINDEDLTTKTTSYFANKVKKGTESSFKLLIKRNNETFEATIDRKKVVIESVSSQIFEKNNKKIGYIFISIFANNTYEQFKQKLEDLETKGIDSLILDFRNNGGGHMYTARKMLGLFLDSNKIVYQVEDKTGIVKTYSEGTVNKTYKIVLITNESSASSSEIVVAGLKENLAAIQVGTKTYGKGTVQELQSLPNGSQYKFTTKKWLTPNGNYINGVGILPDYEIQLDQAYINNPSNETDNQLQKALEILQK